MSLDQAAAPAPSAPASEPFNPGNVADQFSGKIFDMLGMDEPAAQTPERGDGGRFKPREPQAQTPEAKAPDAKPDATAEVAEQAASDEADEDFIELPPEKDGAEPTKLKLSDVLDGFKKSQTLEAQLEEARTKPIIAPEQWDRGIAEAVNTAQTLAHKMEQWQRAFMPVQPDPRQYGTMQEFQAATEYYNWQVQQWQAVDQERRSVLANSQKQAEALEAARRQRHLAQIQEFWPEIKSKDTAQKVQTDLVKHFGKYGMTPDLINSVDHPAFFALAKYALKGLQSEAVKEQAAKVVQQRPKLIKGQARQTTPSKPDLSADFAKLQKSGRAEDAYSIAERLFQ